MIPAFSPQKSAYRLDERVFEASFTTNTSTAFFWAPSGDRIFYGESTGHFSQYATVLYRDASTAFDISTLGAASSVEFLRDTGNNTEPDFDICLLYLDGGTKLIGALREPGENVVIFQYDGLSPAYIDDGTVEAWTNRYEDTAETLGPRAENLLFNSSGTQANCSVEQEIYRATLSTGFDVSTIGAWSVIRDFSAEIGTEYIYSQCFGKTNKNYFIGTDDGIIYEYRLSTAEDISSATFVTSYDLTPTITGSTPRISYMEFVDRGRRFIVHSGGDLYSWATVA